MSINQRNDESARLSKSLKIPTDWDEIKDWQYVSSEGPSIATTTSAKDKCRSELINHIFNAFQDSHGILTHAFTFLTSQSYDQEHIFHHLPIENKVKLLRKLFQQRSRAPHYLERFDENLNEFLNVHRVSVAILERLLSQSETVWLRELAEVSDALDGLTTVFRESMYCEHEERPDYFSM